MQGVRLTTEGGKPLVYVSAGSMLNCDLAVTQAPLGVVAQGWWNVAKLLRSSNKPGWWNW